jgi:hypothetical protein|uniref:Baseplate wedge protein n=1 Tax=Myoviridae sp. ctgsk7 TaxID=2825151 RepID=A0A8S5PWR8_9CAUD|nr:MAG TPA: baseplate wedge protein [Myoviridae sp. ctgsk7]
MFQHTLDSRKEIVDWEGNRLIDLFPSVFDFKSNQIENYNVYKVTENFVCRPDLVSLRYYGTTEKTEYILLYNGISNPFSLDKDDILMVPNPAQADAQMKNFNSESTSMNQFGLNRTLAIKNAYKYISEKKFPKANANLAFDTSNIGDTSTKRGLPTYEVDTDAAAVVVRNGRVYFGQNSGLLSASDIPTANIDAKIEQLVNSALGLLNNGNGSIAGPGDSGNGSGSGTGTDSNNPSGGGTGGNSGAGSGNGSPSNNLCQAINCGDNSCTTNNCLSSGTTLSDILKGYNTIL